jgi:hypothetical protein
VLALPPASAIAAILTAAAATPKKTVITRRSADRPRGPRWGTVTVS